MLPRTTPEQRSRYYDDVETLLSPGFLTHQATLADVRLQLRTLSPGDLFMLRARSSGSSTHGWRVWVVATSIWMIDGRSTLGNQSAIPFMADYLRALPVPTLDTLFSLVLGLFARAQRATIATSAYVFEQVSRYRWATYGQQKSFEALGVPGADQLGLNGVQQIWQAYNTFEDMRLDEGRQWEGFKLVASSNAPKAIKKMDERDRSRRDDESTRRDGELDKFFYMRLGIITKDGRMADSVGGMHRIEGAKTVDDLEDEMRRWVTGDADIHDAVIRDYKQQIRDRKAEEAAAKEERLRFLAERRAEMIKAGLVDEFQPTPLIALTAEDLQRHLEQKGPGYRSGVTFLPKAPDASRLYEQYVGEDGTKSGKLQVQDGRIVDPSASPETDKRTLNEMIKGRNPAFGVGE